MTTPVRLRMSRRKGFDLQAESRAVNGLPAKVCVRPTLYGNPFVHAEPKEAVAAFERYCAGGTQRFDMGPGKLQFAGRLHPNALHHAWPHWLRTEGLPALRGHNLAWWCRLDAPCHADVLLRLGSSNP